MTIAGKNAVSKGSAKLLVRVNRSHNGPKPEWRSFYKADARPAHILVEFNARDELELKFTVDKEEIPKNNKENVNTVNTLEGRVVKIESFKIDEIIDCFANESGDFNNTLIVEVLKKSQREEIVLQFESEQEFRRTLFTYKYFKMRNRLTNSSSSEHSDGSSSPSLSTKSKSSISSNEIGSKSPNYNPKVFDYSTNNNGTASHYIKKFETTFNDSGSNQFNYSTKSLDYMAINGQRIKQNRNQDHSAEQTRDYGDVTITNNKNSKSEYGLQTDNSKAFSNVSDTKSADIGEIDGLIYTDVEYESMEYPNIKYSNNKLVNSSATEIPQKPQRRKQLLRRIKGKAPQPPGGGEVQGWGLDQGRGQESVKGQVVKVNAERGERVPTKDSDGFPPRAATQVPRAHMGASGYESDREEWRSRSTFSSSAFHSLARPARQALAVYYRLSSTPAPVQNPQPAPRKSTQRVTRNIQEYPKNFVAPNQEYIIVSPIPNQDNKRTNAPQTFQQEFKMPFQKQELKYGKMLFNQEYKRNTLGGSMNYLNISNRLYGLTDKLKELGQQNHSRQTWQVKPEKEKKEKGQLKPVIKKSPPQEGSKRPVVRTCSAEPPKKVTFSAFATVQVV